MNSSMSRLFEEEDRMAVYRGERDVAGSIALRLYGLQRSLTPWLSDVGRRVISRRLHPYDVVRWKSSPDFLIVRDVHETAVPAYSKIVCVWAEEISVPDYTHYSSSMVIPVLRPLVQSQEFIHQELSLVGVMQDTNFDCPHRIDLRTMIEERHGLDDAVIAMQECFDDVVAVKIKHSTPTGQFEFSTPWATAQFSKRGLTRHIIFTNSGEAVMFKLKYPEACI